MNNTRHWVNSDINKFCELIYTGASMKDIATYFGITQNNARARVHLIYKNKGFKDRTDMMACEIKRLRKKLNHENLSIQK